MSKDLSSTCTLRLIAEDPKDGVSAVYLLSEGPQWIGSSSTCAVVLDRRGISRRHACLTVRPGSVVLEDLGSKNGVFVDGRRISSCEVPVGAELRFASVVLKLDEADPEDGTLALELGPIMESPQPDRRFGHGHDFEPSTVWEPLSTPLSPSPVDPSPWRWLDAMLSRLDNSDKTDLEGALQQLRYRLKATGAALLDWRAGEPTAIVALSGELGELPSLTRLRRDHSPRPETRLRLVGGDDEGWAAGAWDRQDGALGLMVWGAAPFAATVPDLLTPLVRIFDLAGPRRLKAASRNSERSLTLPEGIVRAISPAMEDLYRQMEQLLETEVAILIQGETGVGKEHLARALHESSTLASGPFVAVNCAAIPAELLEAEMFGIAKGVATGVEARRGRFAEADGGTLFLDEVGEMPLPLQAKLLRALQDKVIQPLGGAPERVNPRVISATNARLPKQVADGAFRQDLYYRLAGYLLEVPPLRDRLEDLPQLVGHFLRRACLEARKPLRGLTVKALHALNHHPWPGNVRELEHEVRRWVLRCGPNQAVGSDHLSPHIGHQPISAEDHEESLDELNLVQQLGTLERRLLIRALDRSGGNQAEAARLLGISRNGIAKRLHRLGLDAKSFR